MLRSLVGSEMCIRDSSLFLLLMRSNLPLLILKLVQQGHTHRHWLSSFLVCPAGDEPRRHRFSSFSLKLVQQGRTHRHWLSSFLVSPAEDAPHRHRFSSYSLKLVQQGRTRRHWLSSFLVSPAGDAPRRHRFSSFSLCLSSVFPFFFLSFSWLILN